MGDDTTRPADVRLTEEHRAFLEAAAVNVDLAVKLGVRSLLNEEDLAGLGDPDFNFRNFPAIVFPWTNEDGRTEWQARPDKPTKDQKTGRLRKYVFGKGAGSILWAVRPVESAAKIVIVEGTKQSLAAASYAPKGIGIYGIAGIRNWQKNKRPIPDLEVADGREVIILPDADAETNHEIYDAGIKLAAALVDEGATKVLFGRLSGGEDKLGLDDLLASRKPETRTRWFSRVISSAKVKPADVRPKNRRTGAPAGKKDDGRVTIVVNEDRHEVINDLAKALLDKWNAKSLFNHGGVISRLEGEAMAPVDRGVFHDLVQATARTVNKTEGAQGTTYSFCWPDAGTMSATISRAPSFASLDRISHSPFVRPDGTVVVAPGYDESTRTLLLPDPVFDSLKVPEEPSPEEIAAARTLILDEWLGDFPLDGAADRANLLGLVVTPAIRGMIPRAPLAVIDGLQMGVGKNLLADVLLMVYTGQPARPMNWVSEPEELRKQITSAFRTGAEFFVFDEAHTLEGAPLAQALTAETWQDRILGVSTMANFPNRVTWMSLGNNVQVKGDITRRVYRIALRPTYADPQDRAASSFRHPGTSGLDLGSWTRKNRAELMTAILTLVRAWFAQGAPAPSKGVSFGSFEAWERTVGGIVEAAGLTDFLGNIKIWRSETDFDTQYWNAHLLWLREQFGGRPFRTGEAKAKAQTAGTDFYPAPPRLDDPTERSYSKALGEAYSRMRGRRYGGLWIDRAASAHGNVALWQMHDQGGAIPPVDPDPEPTPPPPPPDPDPVLPAPEDSGIAVPPEGDTDPVPAPDEDPQPVDKPVDEPAEKLWERIKPHLAADVVTFDLETDDASQLYRGDGSDYIRIGATAQDDRPVIAYGNPATRAVVADLRQGRTITGHNIMAFDLPVIVREGRLKMTDVHRMAFNRRLFDTILVGRYLDPPMARSKGVDASRKYDLGTLAVKYGLGEKLTDVSKDLAKKYSGWGGIPIDLADPDPDRAADALAFQSYMIQDVELSRRLHAAMLAELGGTVPEYLVREHRIAAIAAQISMNGFLVDQELLDERISEIEVRKTNALDLLAGKYGVPTTDAKGVEYKSPLATKGGKEAIGAALLAAGIPEKALWRTPTSGDLQLSSDAMIHYGQEYGGHSVVITEICRAVYQIVSARTVYETILNSLCSDGRVHPKISMSQATGRWSLTDPGLTVLGKRGGLHVERAVLLPDPGEVIISVDLSQIDMRGVAGLSGDQAYIDMLKTDDPHTELAIALFGDAGFREQAKAIGHGWNYGESLKRISLENNIAPDIVNRFDTSMHDRFGRLVEWRDEVRTRAESGNLLDNGFGRPMRPDPQRAHTQGPALMGQGVARDLMMEGLLRLPDSTHPMLRGVVHDEVVLSVPEADADEIGRIVIEALSLGGEPWQGVPIMADVSRPGRTWAECYEKGS